MNKRRFRSLADLRNYREHLLSSSRKRYLVSVSAASCGRAAGAVEVIEAFKHEIEKRGLEDSVELRVTGCHGFCQFEPDAVIFPEKIFYPNLTPEKASLVVENTLSGGKIVPELVYSEDADGKIFPYLEDLPFLQKQVRRLLDRHFTLDPESLDSYVQHDGFRALEKALFEISPEEIVNLVLASGLRGRGGAGFPTGLKWRLAREAPGEEKYLICNGDEGDPGAYMDRGLMESNPFSIVEGMIIGGYAVGATRGFVYVREEYPLAIERMEKALISAREAGFLGENILGSGFSFHLELVRGAGAFVCGEETALIASIEGRRPFPRQRPPFPVVRGLWGRPTVINNVETWANIPLIIKEGPAWFARVGSPTGRGTKIFSLVGQVRRTGLVEVPLGIRVSEVVEEIGGGPASGKIIKAVQTGGPSGGLLPASLFDLPIDYESLQEAGTIMGSGGLIVIDDSTCVVDLALYYLKFARDESCGQCAPCRLGTARMVDILEKMVDGRGHIEDLNLLERIGRTMKEASLCGLGRTAPNPVLSALRYFREELEKHVIENECPAGVCRALVSYEIDSSKCTLCRLCLESCPAGAIVELEDGYLKIDTNICTGCGVCYSVCQDRFSAVRKIPRKKVKVQAE